MVWELGMDDLHSLLFTHPQLKQQMLEGFHQAIKHRMQNNPRARWSGPSPAASCHTTPTAAQLICMLALNNSLIGKEMPTHRTDSYN